MKLLFIKISIVFGILFLLNSCGVKRSMEDRPDITGIEKIDTSRTKISDNHYRLGKNSLYKNKHGIWELYIEGNALERGVTSGSLTRELMHKQETAFMENIYELVPETGYRNFLKKTVAWFNRKMYLHVPEEYKQEIYGTSLFGLEKYNDFAPAYVRMLYFHGAHDIGHALQDLMLVGCTSFAAWDDKTEDGQLLLGRNFDFYAGDEFAEEKIAAFVNPDKGHKFMMYTWAGMIGSVSGLNEKGISVTINAGKSKIPLQAKTPISLVAREILQYATSTTEAIEIAKKREVFVSESIMVGSAKEGRAILIEVAPGNFGVFEVENSNKLICSNHFQSEAYAEDNRNLKTIEESHTQYRFDRMQELLSEKEKLNPQKAAEILRNKEGLEGVKLGTGNEMAINQLLAHHGIIFKPEENKVWISANPYQLGAFVAYDLDTAFKKFEAGNVSGSVMLAEENIAEDLFVNTEAYKDYEKYRKLNGKIIEAISKEQEVSEDKIKRLKYLNPHFWEVYKIAGDYYFQQKEFKKAVINYKQAKRRQVTTLPDEEYLDKMIKKSYRKI
ncbi:MULTISPECIES: C45 family autoproteolytic acyltransferase/hydolase [Salegentibacter]|uniref:Acyl-coenzyme A:6-aminopenicillanic acid acyl-transferase n=2 Tax=Salegentibacter TaxID=143222 RepID=A0A1I2KAA5_9FLAO|nr:MULTISPECIES: C45 family peptidase [Salegentibacter]APS39660.1 acyl-CoA--6-aminopenicillanic acid acyl-transferase [Salegentibacter sp. T436]SFF64042.1 Acyl-coenzyme A:6-aminopenicillanic acid acyl-transferase [Salegentibacter agarivorans]